MRSMDRPWHPFSVLVVSDVSGASRELEDVLEQSGYAVIRSHATDAVSTACTLSPDAVIFDVGPARYAGLEACQQLCGDPRFPATTPVILSAHGQSAEDIHAAYLAGVWHVYDGPIDRMLLLLTLQTYMRARVAEHRLRGTGLIDDETGLYTSDGLVLRARETEAIVTRQRDTLACLAFTVQPAQFPASVDAVDELLRRAALMARQLTRAGDILARVSRTEFVVLALGANGSTATAIVDRLQAHISAWAGGATFRCVVRIGGVADDLTTDVAGLIDGALSALRGAVGADDYVLPSVAFGPRILARVPDVTTLPI